MHTNCANHKTHQNDCYICRRLKVEKQIVQRLVKTLAEAGYDMAVDYGEDDPATPWTKDRKVLMEALGACDDERLLVRRMEPPVSETEGHRATQYQGWVRLVYGNDGWDVICDYTMALEPVMESVNQYASTFER